MNTLRGILLVLALTASGMAQALPVQRCINLSNFLEVAPSESWVYDFEPSHVAAIADAGFDSIRIPAKVSAYWDGQRIDPRFAHLLRDVVARAQNEGLFVIVDIHHFDELIEDPSGYAETFVDLWQALSELFEDTSEIAFELLNEPHDALTTEFLLPYYERAINNIRALHPDAWIIIGTDNWGGPEGLSKLPKPEDPKIVHTFHYYSPFEFTHQQAEWMEDPMPAANWGTEADKEKLDRDIVGAASHHTKTFLGEFGVYHRAPPTDRANWLKTVRQAAEANNIGWCHWGFGAGFGLFDPATQTWDNTLLEALGLPQNQ